MSRKFKSANYEATLGQTISISEALVADHLARFVVDVVAQLDMTAIYVPFGAQGGEAYAPWIATKVEYRTMIGQEGMANRRPNNRLQRMALTRCRSTGALGGSPPADLSGKGGAARFALQQPGDDHSSV